MGSYQVSLHIHTTIAYFKVLGLRDRYRSLPNLEVLRLFTIRQPSTGIINNPGLTVVFAAKTGPIIIRL